MSTRNLSPDKRKEIKDFILANYKTLRVTALARHLSISHPTVSWHMLTMGLRTKNKARILKMHKDHPEYFNVSKRKNWLVNE